MPAKKKTTVKKTAAKKTNSTHKKNPLENTFQQINRALQNFEFDVDGLFQNLVSRGRETREELKSYVDELIEKVKQSQKNALNSQGAKRLEKEIKKMSNELIGRIKDIESMRSSVQIKQVLTEVRNKSLGIKKLVQENVMVSKTMQWMDDKQQGFLSSFNIPSRQEIKDLASKINQLEKKIKKITKKAA